MMRVFAVLAPILAPILAPVLAPVLPPILPTVLASVLPAIALLILLARLLLGGHLARGFGQHAGIMLGMLQEILGSHAVIRQLRVTGEHLVFLDDLLGRTTHLAFGP